MIQWLHQKKNILLFISIFLLSIVLRFSNYTNRWGLAADQARDVLVVRQALVLHQLPLIGPFSASGPYVFGPFWYWVLLIPVALFHNVLLAPWIFLTSLYVIAVGIMYLIGKKLLNAQFGLILSLLTAISPGEVQLSTNLIMSAFVGFLSICTFYFFVTFIKNKNLWQLACMSLLIGIAINTHFEAIPLAILVPVASFFGKRKWYEGITSLLFLLIPCIPLVLFNMQSNSYEITHIFLTNAPQIHVSLFDTILQLAKREFNFFTTILPKAWERAITYFKLLYIGYISCSIFVITIIWSFWKRKITKEFFALLIVIGAITIILGLYGGVIFVNFLAFVYPLLLIFTAWICYTLLSIKKSVGFLLLGILCIAGLYSDILYISQATNNAAVLATYSRDKLIQLFPRQQFAIYNYTTQNTDRGLALSLYLDYAGRLSDDGIEVGVAYVGAAINHQILFNGPTTTNLRLYNLEDTPHQRLTLESFFPYNPSAVYASVEDWYK